MLEDPIARLSTHSAQMMPNDIVSMERTFENMIDKYLLYPN